MRSVILKFSSLVLFSMLVQRNSCRADSRNFVKFEYHCGRRLMITGRVHNPDRDNAMVKLGEFPW